MVLLQALPEILAVVWVVETQAAAPVVETPVKTEPAVIHPHRVEVVPVVVQNHLPGEAVHQVVVVPAVVLPAVEVVRVADNLPEEVNHHPVKVKAAVVPFHHLVVKVVVEPNKVLWVKVLLQPRVVVSQSHHHPKVVVEVVVNPNPNKNVLQEVL